MIAQTIELPTISTMISMEYIAVMAKRADSDMSEGCQLQLSVLDKQIIIIIIIIIIIDKKLTSLTMSRFIFCRC